MILHEWQVVSLRRVIVEIMNEDGTMARRPELEVFADKHNLRIGTIADLIEYRALHEQSVRCTGEFLSIRVGVIHADDFEDLVDGQIQYALTKATSPPELPVRIQPINTLRDVLGTKLPVALKAGPTNLPWPISRNRDEAWW